MLNKRLHSFPLKAMKIDDCYWNKYTKLVPDVVLPYQWKILNDQEKDAAPSYCLQNFKIAAGELKGERKGVVFSDSDVAKWLEAVAYSLETTPNPELEETADAVIALIGRAQCDDGYINTYFTLKEHGKRWISLTEGHELYTAGHLIEAAVAYYHATGKEAFFKIVCRFADLICKVFGTEENQIHGYPGHQEIELALIKLYDVTGKKEYIETAKYFIDARGHQPNYFVEEMQRPNYIQIFPEFSNYNPVYSQSDKPVREQTAAEGHAVRATYMYCAMADLAFYYEDEKLLKCCEKIWDNIVHKRMYITGSIGSSAHLERFTADYDLPNSSNYSETCASIGLVLFGKRMAQINRDASYFDVVERTLYNTVRSGISLEGNRYFYVNPLEVWPDNCLADTAMQHVKPVRQKWFDIACCPTNVARTLTSLGQYIYSSDDENVYINLFIQNDLHTEIAGNDVMLKLVTDFPKSSSLSLQVTTKGVSDFSIHIRIPDYAENFHIAIGGKPEAYSVNKGYACIKRCWHDEQIDITFDMPAKLVSANPNVRADSNKVAIVRGPEIFCLEETDNFKNLPSAFISRSAKLEEHYDETLFGGTTVITCRAKKISDENWNNDELYKAAKPMIEEVTLTAIPYGYWCNRTPGEMLVWLNTIL